MSKSKVYSEKGSIFIELVLVMPVLILLIAGIIQFGFLLNAKIAVNSASYEAARIATLSDNPESDAVNAVLAYASSTMPGWNFDERLSMKIDISSKDPGGVVQIEVTYKIPVFFSRIPPFLMVGGDGSIDMRGSSAMSVEEKE